MRILMISDVYFPRINGVSTSIQTFRRDLQRLGHEVTLIAPLYPQSAADDGTLRVRSHQVPRDPEDRMMRRGDIRKLLPQLRTRQFELVHIQTPFIAHYAGLELARALDVPVVESYHTYFEEYLYHYVPLLPRRLMRFLARRFTCSQGNQVDHLIAPSRAMRDALLQYQVRTPITIIPTGLEADRFEAGDGAGFRARFGIDVERPVVVHVGRIAHEKNIDFLLRMMVLLRAQVPDALLLVAGEGPALAHCRRLAADLGLQDHTLFVGYLDRQHELLDCYRAGDAFVFASRTETQGLVLLEAMAQGVPVISTMHMGTIDILDVRRGCVVVEESEPAFASAAAQLLRNRVKREQLGREAKAYAASWAAQEMAVRLTDLYHEARTRTTLAPACPESR
ncbi:MAG TPA: glycosyltransferase [Steroidobacteraceae bacterium]|nr:glycosyltransferase [Steroidobacteraceae bacterium]